jgi:arsenite methyltransferase
MATSEQDSIRQAVRESYGEIARGTVTGCGCGEGASCCRGEATTTPGVAGHENSSEHLGYSPLDLANVPDGADLGLGCGNPGAIAALKPGEVVLDLGSGGGLDCFLASSQVGPTGRVIGVDMTPDMLAKARRNAATGGYENVEFRLGEIEHLPVADASVDAIISNCVVNLSPGKRAVYAEAMRVLRPGGRLAISDIVATAELPDEARADMDLLTGCVSGASMIGELEATLAGLGFESITIRTSARSEEFPGEWVLGSDVRDYVVSANIEAVKSPTGP